jgi:hypothetical protein
VAYPHEAERQVEENTCDQEEPDEPEGDAEDKPGRASEQQRDGGGIYDERKRDGDPKWH